MQNLVPFSGNINAIVTTGGLPSYLSDPEQRKLLASVNDDIKAGPSYPTLSIKGKVFTLKRDGEATLLTRPDAPDEPLLSIPITVVRANANARVYYENDYAEGAEGEATRPTCTSDDGITPAEGARSPQCDKCAICPHAVWGTGNQGKGTACSPTTRLAIVAPELLPSGRAEPTLLRVPPASRKAFADLVGNLKRHSVPYNAAVIKVGFDLAAPSPKLTFKATGFLNGEAYEIVRKMVDDPVVREIIVTPAANAAAFTPAAATAAAPAPAPAATPAPRSDDDGVAGLFDNPPAQPAAAPAARATRPRKAAAPAPAQAAEQPAAAAPAAQEAPPTGSALLDDLDALLAQTDD